MLQALWSASSGMLAQQTMMDNVSNNIANVNTPGYKKSRTEFQDLLYSQMRSPGRTTITGQTLPNGIQVGSGTRAAANQVSFEQGSLEETGNPTDMALFGNAFFEIMLPDGSKAYTRDGSFKTDADGYLVTGNGNMVNMEASAGGLLNFPQGPNSIKIDSQGAIYQDQQLLKLEQYTFNSTKDLEKVEEGVYKPTDKSGDAVLVSDWVAGNSGTTDAQGNPVENTEKPAVFYQVTLPSGDTAFTAQNSFKIDENGRLVTVDKGYPLEPEVTIDTTATDGALKTGDVVAPDADGGITIPVKSGSLNIVQFANPAGLEKLGSNLYVPTANSGNAQPAADFKVLQGSLETSNVQVAEEMVNMMIANRAYELNSRSIRNSDEMLGMANALLRR